MISLKSTVFLLENWKRRSKKKYVRALMPLVVERLFFHWWRNTRLIG